MRVDFVANASHELRTPLSTVIGYSETLRESDVAMDDDTRAKFLAVVHDEARRMQRVVEDLISLSRIEAEKFTTPTEPVDIAPEQYPFAPGIRAFDLVRDAPALPSQSYDLILHSHVMEHVRGNVTAVLFHLHRALKPDGKQVCCIPVIRERHYAEDLGPLAPDDAVARFGQDDHVRLFGARDIQATLGMIFALPGHYDLLRDYDADLLARHGIPEIAWSGWSANSVLMLGKQDLLLRD